MSCLTAEFVTHRSFDAEPDQFAFKLETSSYLLDTIHRGGIVSHEKTLESTSSIRT